MTQIDGIQSWPVRRWTFSIPRIRIRSERSASTAANVRNAAVTMMVAFALIIVFGSSGVRHFARDLPGDGFTDLLVEAADGWHNLMLELGPARVRPIVRDAFSRLHDAKW